MGNSAGARLLKATLNEEENTDKALSTLAETAVNQAAEAA
jgi:ferritin-like metal-binding protein YciE